MAMLSQYGPVIVKRLPINATGTGDLLIIPAVPGKRIIVFSLLFTSRKATNLTVKSGAVNLISGPIEIAAGQQNQWRDGLYGLFETVPGEPLIFNVTGAGHTLAGLVIYCEF